MTLSVTQNPVVKQQSLRDSLGELKDKAVDATKNAVNSGAHLAIEAGMGYLAGRAVTYIVGSVIMPEVAVPLVVLQPFMPEIGGVVSEAVGAGVKTAVGKAAEMLGSALKGAVTAALHL